MGKFGWLTDPGSGKLEDAEGWVPQGGDSYLAVRSFLLIEVDKDTVLNGPAVTDVELPVGMKRSIQKKVSFSTTTVREIQQSVADTVSAKISHELAENLSTKASATAVAAALEVAGNLSAKSVSELAESINRTLSARHTESTQRLDETINTEEFTVPQSSDGSKRTTRTFAFFKYRKVVVKIYLVRTESLLLQYKRNWIWKRIRQTIRFGTDEPRKALLKVSFYEPMHELSYQFDSYGAQVSDPGAIRVERLTGVCPIRALPNEMELEDLAKIAFPVNRNEDDARRKRRPPAAKKAATKKAAAKRVAAKKAPAKKVAAKKAPAKKVAAKKAPAKKVAARS